jgi:hypothetical protein
MTHSVVTLPEVSSKVVLCSLVPGSQSLCILSHAEANYLYASKFYPIIGYVFSSLSASSFCCSPFECISPFVS